MAFRSMGFWKAMSSRFGGTVTYATSSGPKMKAYAPTADVGHNLHHQEKRTKGEYVPVYVTLGLIVLSVSFGLFTAKQQLMHGPNVRVKKKTRETLPEVEDPDRIIEDSDKFIKKSFFRKIAHVQEFDTGLQYLPDHHSIHRDAFAHTRPHAETLKSVGIDPKQLH